MSRRTQQLFSLSLLDLLTSALGAVIFLFIITPKGGASASMDRQATVYFDTTLMKIHGVLPDSLLGKMSGDTMKVVLMAYQEDPQAEELVRAKAQERAAERAKARAEAKAEAEEQAKREAIAKAKAKPRPAASPKPVEKPKPVPASTPEKPKPEPKPRPKPEPKPASKPSYTGGGPSVPANVSFEVNWKDKDDNIDLFVCKGGDCVYGGKKKNKNIGNWDSGKSRNRIFGNDLRTNQEAVRQFDKIVPGEYQIYAQFKDSKKSTTSVLINGLIYTKDPKTLKERGESFTKKLEIGKGRIHIATLILKADGSYTIKKP